MIIDIIIISLSVIAVGGIIFTIIRNKKKGKSACGCDCAKCHSCSCGRPQTEQKKQDK
ncbi:MAG: FeoB-associated Cys-rich membrane protein [Clostridia bacterium]|nr:FeoB-associated Cys-rich membrane protein [Clostridia bacterium]